MREMILHLQRMKMCGITQKDKEFPVAQSYIDAMATAFGNLTAVRELKETDQLSDYGLENPNTQSI